MVRNLTEDEIKDIMPMTKVVKESLVWKQIEANKRGYVYRFDRKVYIDDNPTFHLYGRYITLDVKGLAIDKTSLLLMHGKQSIRELHTFRPHTDPVTSEMINDCHKHYWTDKYNRARVYRPSEIVKWFDVDHVVPKFLEECQILVNYIPTKRMRFDEKIVASLKTNLENTENER